ncbi:MAG TPA: SsrA-binding protein SmpB [Clostridiaceae bacterium]|nr:SsrA-binding protein SmpB [Clostridiaceae bacterium]
MVSAGKKIITQNRKARFEYTILETYECGIVLAGTEVKSIRNGHVNLKDSYAVIRNGEVFVCGMHVSPYDHGNIFNQEPLRDRKLLLHRSEIRKLIGYIQQKGFTLVPLELYFLRGKVKVLLGVAKGKKLYDKREAIAKKDSQREIDRQLKESFRV